MTLALKCLNILFVIFIIINYLNTINILKQNIILTKLPIEEIINGGLFLECYLKD